MAAVREFFGNDATVGLNCDGKGAIGGALQTRAG
jgi:hypothetical protein